MTRPPTGYVNVATAVIMFLFSSSMLVQTQRDGTGEWWITILRPRTLLTPNNDSEGSTNVPATLSLPVKSPNLPDKSPTSYWSTVPEAVLGLELLSMLVGLKCPPVWEQVTSSRLCRVGTGNWWMWKLPAMSCRPLSWTSSMEGWNGDSCLIEMCPLIPSCSNLATPVLGLISWNSDWFKYTFHCGLFNSHLNLSTGEEAVRMISIVESEVETARPLEIRQRHAGVGVVLLSEHRLWTHSNQWWVLINHCWWSLSKTEIQCWKYFYVFRPAAMHLHYACEFVSAVHNSQHTTSFSLFRTVHWRTRTRHVEHSSRKIKLL